MRRGWNNVVLWRGRGGERGVREVRVRTASASYADGVDGERKGRASFSEMDKCVTKERNNR